MQKFIIGLIFTFLFSTFAFAQEDTPWSIQEMNNLVDQTNFIVDNRCSGTLISLNYKLVLTNYHCVRSKVNQITEDVKKKDGSIVSVKREKFEEVPIVQNRYDGFSMVASSSYQMEIVAGDKERDLAILQFKQKDVPFTKAAILLPDNVKLLRGMHTVTVGNPAMLEASVVRGEISSLTRQLSVGGTKRDYIQISGGLWGGNSGGALFLDDPENGGYLIGVPSAGSQSATFIGLAIPIYSIKEFLKQSCFGDVWDKNADDSGCRRKKAETENE